MHSQYPYSQHLHQHRQCRQYLPGCSHPLVNNPTGYGRRAPDFCEYHKKLNQICGCTHRKLSKSSPPMDCRQEDFFQCLRPTQTDRVVASPTVGFASRLHISAHRATIKGPSRDYEGELDYISNKHLQNIPHR